MAEARWLETGSVGGWRFRIPCNLPLFSVERRLPLTRCINLTFLQASSNRAHFPLESFIFFQLLFHRRLPVNHAYSLHSQQHTFRFEYLLECVVLIIFPERLLRTLEQVAPLHFQNTVGPQQSASLHCGKVWFTVEALIDNGENRYSALKSAGGIGLFAAGTVLAIGTAGAGAAVFAGGAAAATITSAGAGISAATTSVFTSVAGAGSSAVSLLSVFE